MRTGRLFLIRLAEAILAVVLHMFQMVRPDGRDDFGMIFQNTMYSCWVVLLGARLDTELFDLDGLEFPSEVFATLGGSICYGLAGISTMLNIKYYYDSAVTAKGVLAFVLCLILVLEFVLLMIDQ